MNNREMAAGRTQAFDAKAEKGLAGKPGSFKPSVPVNLLRPKLVPVPPKNGK
jgi:hypothetical protein